MASASTGAGKTKAVPYLNRVGRVREYLTRDRCIVICIVLVCLAVSAIGGPHFFFGDEHDNLLGGQMLAHGGAIYRDYFSHHMPLGYFVAAPFMAVFGTHLVLVKMAFGIVTSLWLLLMSRHIFRNSGIVAWSVFVIVLTLNQTSAFANMLLAETLVAYAVCHLFILFYYRKTVPFGARQLGVYAILCAIPLLSSASYAAVSLLGYVMMFVHGWSWWKFTAIKPLKRWLLRILAGGSILAAPYLLLIAYLAATHSLSAFKFQAFTFNELYYSHFTASVSPDGTFYSFLNQLSGTWAGIERVLIEPHSGLPLIPTLFMLGLLLSLPLWYAPRRRTTGLVAAVLLILCGVRNGVPNILQNGTAYAQGDTRIGTPLALLGLTMFVLLWTEVRPLAAARTILALTDHARFVRLYAGALLLFVTIIGAGHALGALQDFHAKTNLVTSRHPAYIPDHIINSINGTSNGTYWLGPADFYSQIFITSKNASSYRFFLPWHGICPSCVTGLTQDLATNHPSVIFFDRDADIWGSKPRDYAKPVDAYITGHYFTAKDPRLKNYYFNPQDRQHIQSVLEQLGYTV